METQNENNTKAKEQEIDLFDICCTTKNIFASFFRGIFDFIAYCLSLLFQYKAIFLPALACVTAWSLYCTTGSRRCYHATLTLRLNAGNSYLAENMINELSDFARKNDNNALADALAISPADAKDIKSIKTHFFIAVNKDSTRSFLDTDDDYKVNDTSNVRVKDMIAIEMGLKARQKFPLMQEALTQYLNSNEYLKELFFINQDNKEEQIELINKDLERIDSLQKKQFFSDKTPEIYLTEKPQIRTGQRDLYYMDKLNLLDKRAEIEELYQNAQSVVTVVSPFHAFSKGHTSFLKMLAINTILLCLLFVIGGSLWRNRANIYERISSKTN